MTRRGLATLFLIPFLMGVVTGHGRLMDPPSRNAMWRLGYPNPVNYNDNELYCGGYVVHYQKNGGRCGVCGDDFREDQPRKHEAGGYFANGIVGKSYVAGQVIEVEAELTTNHWGYMELKLCPHNNPKEIIDQQCLDRYPLPLEGTIETRFIIPNDSKKEDTFKWKVKLPDGITCTNCVMQWKYFTGNTWGFDKVTGEGAVGIGPQETFINCADITIQSNTPSYPTGANVDNPWLLYFRGSFPGLSRAQNEQPLPNGLIPLIISEPQQTLKPLVVRSNLCIPEDTYKNDPNMDKWCRENCLKYPPNCPVGVCRCVHECRAIGEFALKHPSNDIFCNQNCLGYPSNCPEDKCECF